MLIFKDEKINEVLKNDYSDNSLMFYSIICFFTSLILHWRFFPLLHLNTFHVSQGTKYRVFMVWEKKHFKNCYAYILLVREFFAASLADGFPLESEWQQVTSSTLQDFS